MFLNLEGISVQDLIAPQSTTLCLQISLSITGLSFALGFEKSIGEVPAVYPRTRIFDLLLRERMQHCSHHRGVGGQSVADNVAEKQTHLDM